MPDAVVMPLPDGRFSLECQNRIERYVDEEEAVEQARQLLQRTGGGTIHLLDAAGKPRDQIRVRAKPVSEKEPPSFDAPSKDPTHVPRSALSPRIQHDTHEPSGSPREHSGDVKGLVNLLDAPSTVEDLARKAADQVIKGGLSGWWLNRNTKEQLATVLIGFALALGPLGQGILAALGVLFNNKIPNSTQLEALFFLFWITAPLSVFVVLLVWLTGKHAVFPVTLVICGLGSVAVPLITLKLGAPEALAGLYCYADFRGASVVYEEQCRNFEDAVFIAENMSYVGSPSDAVRILSSAFAYTSDARGSAMALSAIYAGIGVGLLLREHS